MAEWILGIETSCDETSAAVLRAEGGVGSLASVVILSQDVHRIFGGVVPELASRAHVQAIGSVVERALVDAGIEQSQLDGIVVTAGPGLVGALLVGVMLDPEEILPVAAHVGLPVRRSLTKAHIGWSGSVGNKSSENSSAGPPASGR